MDKLMTKREICELLQISESTLERIVADGDLPALRIRGQLRFLREDLLHYLARCGVSEQKSAPRKAQKGPRLVSQRERYIPGMKVV